MPRTTLPSAGEVRRAEARHRTGCWPCKQAHSRCQEQRPCCSRCQRLGLACAYGIRLLWKEDAAQRGICLGREGVWSKAAKGKKHKKSGAGHEVFLDTRGRRPIFLNTTYAHMSEDGRFVDDEEEEGGGGEVDVARADPRPQPWGHGQLSYKEAYLFDYFTSFICPNCSLSPTHNPYLRYIAPMALSYTPLQHVILSVAANQLRLLNDKRYEREAWLYKARAMNGLRASIDAGAVGWPFVATVLMLCFYDISDGCDESWMTHLKGGLGVLQHVQSTDSLHTEAEALTKFFMMYFVAHQIMSSTARHTHLDTPGHAWLDDDCMDEIDALMGCSRGLLSLIDRTSTAASYYSAISLKRALSTQEHEEIRLVWGDLSTKILEVPQVAPTTGENIQHLVLVADCKRTAALLYLHERFAPFLPSNTVLSKESSVAALVSQLAALPATPTLLWPLFILGRASPANEEHRRFVLDRLAEMQRLRNLGSVRLARRLIEGEYRKYDLSNRTECEVGVRGKWISLA